jgi:hypothetical protein
MAYAHAVGVGGARPCTEGALATLRDVSARAAGYVEATDGWAAQEGALQAKANAAVVANAESYYRQMMFGDGARWPGGGSPQHMPGRSRPEPRSESDLAADPLPRPVGGKPAAGRRRTALPC